ncbi:MAG: hypothetical protein FWB72_02400 [Firmicutes bacterium]|nr:hypothetical protein [Bacillota bacterium]
MNKDKLLGNLFIALIAGVVYFLIAWIFPAANERGRGLYFFLISGAIISVIVFLILTIITLAGNKNNDDVDRS